MGTGGTSIASLYATIGADTTGFQNGLGSAKSALSTFGTSLAGQLVSVASVTTAIAGLGKLVSSSVTDWADYADSMRISADMAGVTTEEMSKLVQAADDFRVPIDAMQRSMEMALKNGFVPTIENLANLSDELIAIKDPAERAAKASEIFGKSYADMLPFLLAGGDAIRASTDAISENLIVTEESAAEAKAYKDQVDALGDAWTGLKNVMGEAIVPVITPILVAVTDALDGTTKSSDDQRDAFAALTDAYNAGAMSAEQYAVAVGNVHNGTIDETAGLKIADDAMAKHNKTVMTASDANQELLLGLFDTTDSWVEFQRAAEASGVDLALMTEEVYNSEKALGDTSEAVGLAEKYLLSQSEAADKATAAWQEYVLAVKDITSLTTNFGSIITLAENYDDLLEDLAEQEQIMADAPIGSEKWVDAKTKVEELKQSMTDLANQMTLDLFQVAIAADELVSDAEMGAYFQMAADMGLISEEAASAAIKAWRKAKATVEAETITGTFEIDDGKVRTWMDFWDAYKPETKTATVIMQRIEAGLPPVGPAAPTEPFIHPGDDTPDERATGGSVFGGVPYIVGEWGRELFVPESSGQIISNNSLKNIGETTVINNYNLTMPTTASAGDIKMAFELMEAWA